MPTNSPGNYISTNVVGDRFGSGAPVNGANAVQTITSTATGGTFTLTLNGLTTAALPFNASAATIQAALQGLYTGYANNIVCTGGPLPTAVVVTFTGDLAGLPAGAITVNNALATGGVVSVAQTTAGVAGTARGALTGARYTDVVAGKEYINTGTAATPVWAVS